MWTGHKLQTDPLPATVVYARPGGHVDLRLLSLKLA